MSACVGRCCRVGGIGVRKCAMMGCAGGAPWRAPGCVPVARWCPSACHATLALPHHQEFLRSCMAVIVRQPYSFLCHCWCMSSSTRAVEVDGKVQVVSAGNKVKRISWKYQGCDPLHKTAELLIAPLIYCSGCWKGCREKRPLLLCSCSNTGPCRTNQLCGSSTPSSQKLSNCPMLTFCK